VARTRTNQKKIEGRKDKIVEAIKKKRSIQTGEVQDMFEISRNTAYRYLNELEKTAGGMCNAFGDMTKEENNYYQNLKIIRGLTFLFNFR